MRRRRYTQRFPHPVGVYRSGWGTWYAQVTLGGQQYYLGVVPGPIEGAALVAAFRRQMTPEVASLPTPISTKGPPPAEEPQFWR